MKLKIRTIQRIYDDRRQRLKQWHLWFAWRPVRLDSHSVAWMEKLYRRIDYYGGYEYRTKEEAEA